MGRRRRKVNSTQFSYESGGRSARPREGAWAYVTRDLHNWEEEEEEAWGGWGKWEKRVLERTVETGGRGGGGGVGMGRGSRKVEERGEESVCGGAAPAEIC